MTLTDVSIGYRTRQGVKTVAKGITAALHSGELTCLLGRNGVGKSTLLRTLSAFQPPLGGSISICGRQLQDYNAQQLARTIGVVLTERPDVQQMKVWELVSMGRSPYTGFWGRLNKEDEQVVDEAVAMVGIGQLTNRQVTTLSDGERQKVMIAKALAQQTSIIFLDEPTAFLDYPSKVDTLLLLRRICREQQKTVFLSTHDLELALQVADRLWLMETDDSGQRLATDNNGQGLAADDSGRGFAANDSGRGLAADGNGRLFVGTPRDLADEGILSHFIEGEDVSFDANTFSIRIKKRAV